MFTTRGSLGANSSFVYFTDEETKEDLGKLRGENLPIASLTFKINNVTLFQEHLENKLKLKRGFKIKNLILQKKREYLEKRRTVDLKLKNCKAEDSNDSLHDDEHPLL